MDGRIEFQTSTVDQQSAFETLLRHWGRRPAFGKMAILVGTKVCPRRIFRQNSREREYPRRSTPLVPSTIPMDEVDGDEFSFAHLGDELLTT